MSQPARFLPKIITKEADPGEPGQPSYLYRILNAIIGSEFVPARHRTKALQLLGFDLADDVTIWSGCSFRSNKVKICSNVFINVGFFYDGFDQLYIGNGVRIGQFVRIITASHEIGDSSQRGRVDTFGKPIRIEDGCWVGCGAYILPGAVLAKGCILGAGSVLLDRTYSDGLYVGNPARRVRDLST